VAMGIEGVGEAGATVDIEVVAMLVAMAELGATEEDETWMSLCNGPSRACTMTIGRHANYLQRVAPR